MYENKEYYSIAMSIRKTTGRPFRTCYFCVRCAQGNYQKALELCSGNSSKEDGR